MRILRDQRGQTAAEYLGLILVVAALIAAIAATDLGEQLGANLEAAVCQVVSSEAGGCDDDRGRAPTAPTDAPGPDLEPPSVSGAPAPVGTIPVGLGDGGAPPGYDCFEPYVDPDENPTVPLSPCQAKFETERDGGEYIETPEEYDRAVDELGFPLNFLAPRSPLDLIPGPGKAIGPGVKALRKLGDTITDFLRRRPRKVDPGDAAKKLKKKRAKQVKENKKVGERAERRIAARHPGSRTQVGRRTRLGPRYIDVLTRNGLAIESKVGRVPYSKVKRQVAKDIELRRQRGNGVRQVEWHFTSNKRGEIGPDPKLEAELKKAGIRIVYDP